MSARKILKGIWKVKNKSSQTMTGAEATKSKDISRFIGCFAEEKRDSTFEFIFLGKKNTENRVKITRRKGRLFMEVF